MADTRTDQADKADRFRALHERDRAFVIPNPWDGGSARVLTALGFEALATTSAGAAAVLGRRDGAIGREAIFANARLVVDATDLPVSADLENGFGPAPADVAATIAAAAEIGLVGGSIEDASGTPEAPIYALDEAVARVAAAVAAARALPFAFTLTARAENFLHGRRDLDDTIARLRAFEAAGADVLYAPGLPDLEAIRTVCAAVSRPVNVLCGDSGWTLAALAEAGVRRVSLGGALNRVALTALDRAARDLLDGHARFLAETIPHADMTARMA